MEKRRRNAPYISIKALMDFLDHIRYVSTPKKVDAGLLEDYGISKGNVFALLSALKYLGIVEDSGNPTPAFSSLQTTGEEFQGNLRKVVEDAYADLFGRLDVSRDSREHIRNYFARNYSVSQSERATSLFLDLSREAGIPIAQESRGGKAEAAERTKVARSSRQRTKQPVQASVSSASPTEDQSHEELTAARTAADARPNSPGISIKIDSKDLVSMNPQQLQALFEGLSKVAKLEEEKGIATTVAGP